jgi:F-type H+-transporting ATPase subunit a
MDFRTIFNAARRLITSAFVALLAWVALSNSPLWLRYAEASRDSVMQEHDVHQADQAKSGDHGDAAHHDPNALEHVTDSKDEWHLFMAFPPKSIPLPHIGNFYITKFMILEVIAALLICVIYIPLAKKIQSTGVPRGAHHNFFEVLLTFIRDQVAKPSLGEHEADRFVPFLWTMFLFILFNNLLGMVPFGGSATASLYVTGALALIVFGFMHGSGVAKMGFGPYVASLWPHMDVPFPLGYFIKPLVFTLEWVGVIVRNAVLAVRLFANMFAGHTVLATLLIFIYMARNTAPLMWAGITVSSVFGIIALSLLELFVAFLQAFIFTFLTALFMGMALHPEH